MDKIFIFFDLVNDLESSGWWQFRSAHVSFESAKKEFPPVNMEFGVSELHYHSSRADAYDPTKLDNARYFYTRTGDEYTTKVWAVQEVNLK